jgi:hypothetical protein
MTTPDTSPSTAPPPAIQLYRPGVVGLTLLADAAERQPLAYAALVLRCHREGGLPRPLAPSTLADLLSDCESWLSAEAEAGRDATHADLRAAQEALTATTIKASDIPQPPSQS